MSDLEIIRATVERVARRRRWQRGWTGLWRGVLVGGCVWLGAVALYKVLPLPASTLLGAAGLAGLALVAGFVRGMARRESHLASARWVDQSQHLEERLSTAWELAEEDRVGEWRDLLLADAARRVRDFKPEAALPYGLPKWAGWIVLVLALGAGIGFAPEYRSARYLEQRAVADATKEAGRQLSELTARQLERQPPALEGTRELLQAVEELGVRLGKVDLNRDQALRDLANIAEQLRAELGGMGRRPELRRLDAGNRGGGGSSEVSEDLRRQAEALQEQLGRQSPEADAAEKLEADLAALRQAAANLPTGDSAAATAARAQMSEMMAQLVRQAEELGVELPSLDAAMQALRAGRMDQVLQQLQFAAIDLEQLAKMSRSLEQLQAQLADLGKDLAEQLEKGQGWPARNTLRQMQEALRRGELSQAEMSRILDEVRRAVAPGNEYGRAGEFLAAAARGLGEGKQAEAADQLSAAAEELRRLMDQLEDGTTLMAALGNLQTAQMCIGNGQGWALCRSQTPGVKPGGLPGSGVGTWADEGTRLDGVEPTELWDNTGVERPDRAARGETDRGAGEPSSALAPTQVRGQIGPGGAMPAVTLRGLSVRGQSRVEYREAVTAAQADAQSALSQERVPRAYRGAVRQYFDDLKP